ncbi:MAG TPA: hypothetical protein DCQ16_00120 [Spirochaetaceae bacterium]|jgi:hypothetical protein|nr:MAG: hypothetical protein A4E53_00759 [Pelotomaculum sp. PtaB.Bin104]VBB40369.1 conserved hypothetical protein [uncultured Spirochaetota bacterium]HAP54393.1 hypothetical protein [Spirochaetaceae bacterium]HOI23660.1 ImmA/IrrE family metallo-endopeptidase [Spirochaetales bacterium]
MLSDDLCPPFLEISEIKQKVASFRARFPKLNTFPVDIEALIEQDLGISIQPIRGLRSSINIDAFISSDFRILYVDEYEYMSDRFENKLRFSFAHEISHLVLHAELYRRQDFHDKESYLSFHMSKSDRAYRWYESQANIFAVHLLMPVKELTKVLAEIKERLRASGDPLIRIRSSEYLNDLARSEAAAYFGVAESTLSNFLSKEHIRY